MFHFRLDVKSHNSNFLKSGIFESFVRTYSIVPFVIVYTRYAMLFAVMLLIAHNYTLSVKCVEISGLKGQRKLNECFYCN